MLLLYTDGWVYVQAYISCWCSFLIPVPERDLSCILGAMEHRDLTNTSQLFNIGQDQNRSHIIAETSHIDIGRAIAPDNGSIVYSVDNIPRSGQYCYSQQVFESRATEPFTSSFRVEGPPVRFSHPGSSYDSFPHIPAGEILYNTAPENDASGHVLSGHYNRNTIHEVEGGSLHHTVGAGRGPLKRKSPSFSVACERGSTSRFYGAGSSSNSVGFELEKHSLDYQYYPTNSIGLPHYRGDSLSFGSEDPPTARNMRSRSRIDLEPNPNRTYLSNYSSHAYCSTAHSLNHSRAVGATCLNADATAYNQNHIAVAPATHGRFQTPGYTGLRLEMNQHFVGGSSTESGVYSHDGISSRSHVSTPQHLYGYQSQATREDRSNYSRRAYPSYRPGPSSSHFGRESTPPGRGLELLSEAHSSRFSRPFSGGWRNNHRETRSRMEIERFQSHSNAVDSHGRMSSEALMMEGRSLLYGSRNLFDQYRDMRLDIDNMSYEELLALGERMGNVSTGLSEEVISECLRETRFASDENQEEASCAICLEDYKNNEEIGTVKNCGHDYHVVCIKRWLLMKNACPVCKAAALADSSKE